MQSLMHAKSPCAPRDGVQSNTTFFRMFTARRKFFTGAEGRLQQKNFAHFNHRLSRIVISDVHLILLAFVTVIAINAQEYDVASVRPHAPGTPCEQSNTYAGGRLILNCFSLFDLVRESLDIFPEELTGGPAWIKTDWWDISARQPGIAGELEPKAYRAMILAIARDRFGLELDRRTSSVNGYALIVARHGRLGPALHPNTGAPYRFDIAPRISLIAQRLAMNDFAAWLKSPMGVGQRVENQTGLTGDYDLTLKWTPQRIANDEILSADAPIVFTALQEQLGLKLRSQKITGEVYVIKVAHRPEPE